MSDKPATERAIDIIKAAALELRGSLTGDMLSGPLLAIAEGLRPRNPNIDEMPPAKPEINVAWMAVMLDGSLRAFRPTILVEGRRYVLEGDPMPQAESDALVRRSDEALGALQVRAVEANVELIVEQRLAKALRIATPAASDG